MPKKFKRLSQFFTILLLLMFVIVVGFMQMENLPFFDSLWMTIVSVLAIGYGDYTPSQDNSKIFSMILIPITMGFTTYMLTFIAASMVEGHLSKKFERKKRMKQIDKMKNHYIICDFERVGEQVYKELKNQDYHILIIDSEEEKQKQIPEGTPYLIADAKQNEVLQKAGVERARGLVATSSDDATNVFITLTAKGLNEHIEVIARAEKDETESKLKRAGADHVVIPSALGGRRMALSLVKPVSMHYVDSITHAEDNRYQINEYKINHNSRLIEKPISNLPAISNNGLSLLGIQREQSFISNPSEEERVQQDDVLVLFGEKENLKSFSNKLAEEQRHA